MENETGAGGGGGGIKAGSGIEAGCGIDADGCDVEAAGCASDDSRARGTRLTADELEVSGGNERSSSRLGAAAMGLS